MHRFQTKYTTILIFCLRSFKIIFLKIFASNLWILNPFMCDIASEDVNLSTDTEDELLQLSEDSNLKLSFKGKELLDLWTCAISEYPILAKRAVKFILPFTTTYLCESCFSHVTIIKTKQKNCMLTSTLSACLSLQNPAAH